MRDQLLYLLGCWVARAWRRFSDVALRELPDRIGINVVPCNRTGAKATQGRQIAAHGRTFDARLHPAARIVGEATTRDLVEMQVAEHRTELAETGAISLLRSEL